MTAPLLLSDDDSDSDSVGSDMPELFSEDENDLPFDLISYYKLRK